MIDYNSGKGAAFPFHLTNLLLHLCNTLLLFFILNRLFNDIRISFIAAFLFAIHPVHVESVAWITSRKDLLFTFFYLLSMLCYLNYREKRAKGLYYLLTLVLFMGSMLSKVQAVTFPLILFAIDSIQSRKISKTMFLDKIPFFVVAAVIGVINIQAQREYGYIQYGSEYSAVEQAILIPYAFSQYLLKSILPLSWSVFYPFPVSPGQPISWHVILSLILLVVIIALVSFLRKARTKVVIFGSVFFSLNIVVVFMATIHRDAVIAERYLYLGSAGIFMVISYLFVTMYDTYPKLKVPLAISLLIYLTFLTYLCWTRTNTWRDQRKLFEHALSQYPESEIILNTLGSIEITENRFPEAIDHLTKAIECSPRYVDAYYNRGLAYDKTGEYQKAIQDFSAALMYNHDYVPALFARGNVFRRTQQYDQAIHDYSMALQLDPMQAGVFQNRAIVWGYLNEFRKAVDDLNQAIRLDPNIAACYYLRGIALFEINQDGCPDLRRAQQMGYQDAKKALAHYCR